MAKPPQNNKSPEGNPRAASTRIQSKNARALAGQRKHDKRIGRQSDYIDESRKHLNRIIMEPDPPSVMRAICEDRRSLRNTKRKMKKDASVAGCGIITFGSEAAALFEALTPEAQDKAFLDLAESIADRLNTTLHGLVVHRDETTIHAHYQIASYNLDGVPLSQATRPAVMSSLQDLTAEVMARHCPGIERGNRYGDRLKSGADFRDTLHRTVRELHRDIPRELETKRAEILALDVKTQEAQARVDEMQGRVDKLTEKAELSEKEAKRLATYEKRLADRVAELETEQGLAEKATAEERRLADIARDEAEEARQEAQRVSDKTGALLNATIALTAEMTAGTLRRTKAGKIHADNPDAIRPGFPDIGPALSAATDAIEARRREEAKAETAKTNRIAEEERAETVQAEARKLLDDAKEERDNARTAWEEVRGLQIKLKNALAMVTKWLKRPDLARGARLQGEAMKRVIEEDKVLTQSMGSNDADEDFAL